MRIIMFYHSLVSDWNNSSAHFLRGVTFELMTRGHDIRVYEPRDGSSLLSLQEERGDFATEGFKEAYPGLVSVFYDLAEIDLPGALDGADLVIVHERNDRDLVRRIGAARAGDPGLRLLFHDTNHRSVTDPQTMAAYDLSNYDGVLAFGESIRNIYIERNWAARAWTWHESADIRVFCAIPDVERQGDLVWVGNWADEQRTADFHEYLLGPIEILDLKARAYGVGYPPDAISALGKAGIWYAGWLPNYEVPEVFAGHAVTVHIPRRPYTQALPGIPSIRVFEALACGIPLVSAPWDDVEGLFSPGRDFLLARNGLEMNRHLRMLLEDETAAHELRFHGLRTVRAKHTCAHRVDQLLDICRELGLNVAAVHRPLPTPTIGDT